MSALAFASGLSGWLPPACLPYIGPGELFIVDPDGALLNTSAPRDRVVPTWADAYALCQSGRGDTILMAQGSYAENAEIEEMDYLHVVGMNTGYGRPDIGPATGHGLVVTKSQGVSLARIRVFNEDNSDTVRIDGNGGRIRDCVFDGNALQATTKGVLRMWTDSADDSFTGSEWDIEDLYIRGGGAKGLVIDCQHALVGVLPTDNHLKNVRYADNVAEDIYLAATAVSVADMNRWVFENNQIGIGKKNKATHIDLKTNKIGTSNFSVMIRGSINDDTPDTTALKTDGTGFSFIGVPNLDGLINGDGID